MPIKRSKRSSNRPSPTTVRAGVDETVPPPPTLPPMSGGGNRPETTGRFIVILRDTAVANASAVRSTLNNVAGVKHVASSKDFDAGVSEAAALGGAEALHFESLGVMVMDDVDAVAALAQTASDVDSPVMIIEPEYIAHPVDVLTADVKQYLRGFRDAANHIYDQLIAAEPAGVDAELSQLFQDTAQFTWGLQAIGAHKSAFSGQGVKVAILDTGLDFTHPDFKGRQIESASFSGVPVQDVHGHGTHCAGTACGPMAPASGVRRYGIAHGAHLHVAKVFDNAARPSAPTAVVLAGIDWALQQGCRVASLSLGVAINQKIQQYEKPMQRALDGGMLIVAAAGNNARRSINNFGFVEPPANADATMAVAAIDRQLRMADFSARSSQVTGMGGIVNIAAPGVAVYSSVPVALGAHALFDGTSMATPHVAGVAALIAGATGESGQALWNKLVQTAQPLKLPSVDVGTGLLRAP